MKSLIYWILLAIPFTPFMTQTISAQGVNWFESGSQWLFTNTSFATYEGYDLLTYIGDTLINNIPLKIINQKGHFSSIGVDKDYDFDSYYQQRGDSILVLKNDSLHLLYDFSLEVGDTVNFFHESWKEYGTYGIVAGYDTIDANGHDLRFQSVHMEFVDQFYYGPEYMFNIEKFGTISGFGPFDHIGFGVHATDWPQYSFACYQSDTFGFYNHFDIACDYLATGTRLAGYENEFNISLHILPNPAANRIILSDCVSCEYLRIYNSNGQPLITVDKIERNEEIDISSLVAGMYIVMVEQENRKLLGKLIVNK